MSALGVGSPTTALIPIGCTATSSVGGISSSAPIYSPVETSSLQILSDSYYRSREFSNSNIYRSRQLLFLLDLWLSISADDSLRFTTLKVSIFFHFYRVIISDGWLFLSVVNNTSTLFLWQTLLSWSIDRVAEAVFLFSNPATQGGYFDACDYWSPRLDFGFLDFDLAPKYERRNLAIANLILRILIIVCYLNYY